MNPQFRPSQLSPAASALGMGDQIKEQLALQEQEKKKKLMMNANNMQTVGPGTLALFGITQ